MPITNRVRRLEDTTSTIPGTTGSAGIWVDSNDVLSHTDSNGAKVEVPATTATQTLTNKTITGVSATMTGAIVSTGTAGIGYATGAGSTVSQATNRSTGVTLSKICGQITGQATSLAAGAEAIFTVTNTLVGLHDVVVLNLQSGATANTSVFSVCAVAAGSFDIKAHNLHASTADTGAPVLNFAVIKAVSA